jgi:hypothetical protein
MSDAEWLAGVAAHGMIRPSFVPPPPIRELRELTRYRKTQAKVRAQEIARLEKALQDAGIKLTSVASKVLTQSGRAMIEALIAGQRDPAALAALAKGKLRPKIPQLTAALDGHFGPITPWPPPGSWHTWTSWTPRSPSWMPRSAPGSRPAISQPPGGGATSRGSTTATPK